MNEAIIIAVVIQVVLNAYVDLKHKRLVNEKLQLEINKLKLEIQKTKGN